MIDIDTYRNAYPGSFVEYDIPKARETADSLDGEIMGLLDELSRNGSGTSDGASDSTSTINKRILDAIDRAKEKHGDKVAGLYEALYGCVLNEAIGNSLEGMFVAEGSDRAT